MLRGYLALVLEFHHPLPDPGHGPGRDWAEAAASTYWPLVRAITSLADAGVEDVLTVAVSPAWTALGFDPDGRAMVRTELDRRADDRDSPLAGRWHTIRQFVVDRWAGDLLAPLRRAEEAGTIELIPTCASHAWLPSVAAIPVLARAQVDLAVADHTSRFGSRPQGIWLPHRGYLPGLEGPIAASGVRYFGVDPGAFRRGTVRPPLDLFGPLITPAGAAAFGVDPEPTYLLSDPGLSYARDPRYRGDQAADAIADHATHFHQTWRTLAERRAPSAAGDRPISVASVSAHDLGGSWLRGPGWLERFLTNLRGDQIWVPTTLGRYLDRHPEGPLGRPGTSSGGIDAVLPGGSDVLDRVRAAADILADALLSPAANDRLGRRVIAQLARELLRAQALDWSIPPEEGRSPEQGLARAEAHLEQFAVLAGALASGRPDAAELARFEAGPPYLADIDIRSLAWG